MSETDMFGPMRKASQAKRLLNRDNALRILDGEKIEYKNYSNGTHLGVFKGVEVVNFWPGTGLWRSQNRPREGRGIQSLINYVRETI